MKEIKKKVIIIHGCASSPKNRKYQIIAKELAELGIDYSIPAMPGGEYPCSDNWLKIIDEEVNNTDKPVVLVGHSLGTRAILLYLDKYQQEVDAVILIATFNNNFKKNRKGKNHHYQDFFDYALDIEQIKKLSRKFIVIHSKDDESIDYKQGVEMSRELKAKWIAYKEAGHFSGSEGAEKNAKYFLEFIKLAL